MITLSLDAPDSWVANLREAAATWPRGVAIESGDGPATISMAVCDSTEPTPDIGVVEPGCARGFLFCHAAPDPERLTSWARRSVLRTALDPALSWPTDEFVHEAELPRNASAVRATRREITALFGHSQRVDDLVLAASELAANAVQHGHGPTSLAISTRRGAVVIEVGDRAPTRAPTVLPLRPSTSSGRGMAIVDVVSDCWGVLALTDSKVVWCEFLDVGPPMDVTAG
jgi:anti-sigma regulatory factor (Ser/Thr protein kinase)